MMHNEKQAKEMMEAMKGVQKADGSPAWGWCSNCKSKPAGSVGGLCDDCRALQFEAILTQLTMPINPVNDKVHIKDKAIDILSTALAFVWTFILRLMKIVFG